MTSNLPRRSGAVLLAVAAALLSSCSASGSLTDSPERVPRGPDYPGAAVTLRTTPKFQEIRVLEGERDLKDGRLLDLLMADSDPEVRARAALALGRMPFPAFGIEVTGPLCAALKDEEESVRAAAAQALGLRADPKSAFNLLANWVDTSALVRRRLVEAASRVQTPPIRTQITRSMRDPDLEVRQIAIRCAGLWPTDLPDAGDTDSALLRTLSPYPDASGQRVVPDENTIWCTLYALSRRKAEKGRGAFLQHATNPDARARLFAIRGLASIAPSDEGTAGLIAALKDRDWRVACEAAIGLGIAKSPAAVKPLVEAVDHRSSHVRLRALEAMGTFEAQSAKVLPQAWRGRQDLSASVRAAALGTLARLLGEAETAQLLEEAAHDDDAVVRAGAATAASKALQSFRAIPILEQLAHDRSDFVSRAAILGLKLHLTPRARAILHEYLGDADNGRRLAAVEALAHENNARESDISALTEALTSSTGDVSAEVVFSATRCLGKIAASGVGGAAIDGARRALLETLTHRDAFVQQVAREVLRRDFGHPLEATTASVSALRPGLLPGRDFPAWEQNPVVEIVTSRGSMTFELLAEEAPLHVDNFLRQANDGHYDGLPFHRVVPDFVIQGGDYRGDGNGAVTARGGPLRQEFSTRPFERGSLGMPRNEDFDSGGSQFFVTHRDTPHLDGRYTLFGVLRGGGDVLDAIEVGDVILRIVVGS